MLSLHLSPFKNRSVECDNQTQSPTSHPPQIARRHCRHPSSALLTHPTLRSQTSTVRTRWRTRATRLTAWRQCSRSPTCSSLTSAKEAHTCVRILRGATLNWSRQSVVFLGPRNVNARIESSLASTIDTFFQHILAPLVHAHRRQRPSKRNKLTRIRFGYFLATIFCHT